MSLDDDLLVLAGKLQEIDRRVNYLERLQIGTISLLNIGAGTELTIATGEITVTQSRHTVDTEGDAASDDLDTINGGSEGDILILAAISNARTVVVKDSTGNITTAGDFSLDNGADRIMLVRGATNWRELSRSDNAA